MGGGWEIEISGVEKYGLRRGGGGKEGHGISGEFCICDVCESVPL